MIELTPTFKRSKEVLNEIKNKAQGDMPIEIDS